MYNHRIIFGFLILLSTDLNALQRYDLTTDTGSDRSKTLLIDGCIVDEREYKREYDRHRSPIMIKYTKQLADKSKFLQSWQTPINGISPSQNLEDTVLYTLKRLKIQEKLLNKYGLWHYTNYEQLLKDMHQTNQNRKIAVAEGKVIYGPVEYSERTFYDYKFSNAIIQLKKIIDGKEIIYADADLYNYFKEKVLPRSNYEEADFQRMKNRLAEWLIEDRYKLLIDSLSEVMPHKWISVN